MGMQTVRRWYAVTIAVFTVSKKCTAVQSAKHRNKIEPAEIARQIRSGIVEENLKGRKIIGIADPSILMNHGESIVMMNALACTGNREITRG
ncbi:MAG: hypothetical protein ACLUOI_28965 [Eisenbergiella sp.]